MDLPGGINTRESQKFEAAIATLHASAAETASGQSAGEKIEQFSEANILVDVTAVTGTNPTINIKIQSSDDNSDWYDTGDAFAEITATGKVLLKITNFGKYIRIDWTIGGTDTPTFTFAAKAVAKR